MGGVWCPDSALAIVILLCVIFGLITVISTVQIIRICVRTTFCSSQLSLHILIFCSVVARLLNFILAIVGPYPLYCPLTVNNTNTSFANYTSSLPLLQISTSNKISFIVSVFPTALFFSLNSVFVLTWSRIYLSSVQSAAVMRTWLRIIFIVTNTISTALVLVEVIFAAVDAPEGQLMNTVWKQLFFALIFY